MSKKASVRSALALSAVLALAVVTASGALASPAKKGKVYMTQPLSKVFATFRVSANGKKVTNVGAGIAVKCKGSAGGFPSATKSGSGKITKHGTFKVVLQLYPPGPAGQKSTGTDTVTGKFIAGGKATGTVRTHFNGQNSQSFCRGVKQSYTATAIP